MGLAIYRNPIIESITLELEENRSLIKKHFQLLDEESKRNRFCSNVSDDLINTYVDSINSKEDYMFGIFSEHSIVDPYSIVALAHLPRIQQTSNFELALSVSNTHRRRGLATSLLEEILFIQAPYLGVSTICCHCLYTNRKVQQLFSQKGVNLKSNIDDGSTLGSIEISRSSFKSHIDNSISSIAQLQSKLTRTGIEYMRIFYL